MTIPLMVDHHQNNSIKTKDDLCLLLFDSHYSLLPLRIFFLADLASNYDFEDEGKKFDKFGNPLEENFHTSFTLFGLLSTDLRRRIWGFTPLEPTWIIQCRKTGFFTHTRKVPAVLQVCRESRDEFLDAGEPDGAASALVRQKRNPVYRLLEFAARDSCKPTYNSYEIDTFCGYQNIHEFKEESALRYYINTYNDPGTRDMIRPLLPPRTFGHEAKDLLKRRSCIPDSLCAYFAMGALPLNVASNLERACFGKSRLPPYFFRIVYPKLRILSLVIPTAWFWKDQRGWVTGHDEVWEEGDGDAYQQLFVNEMKEYPEWVAPVLEWRIADEIIKKEKHSRRRRQINFHGRCVAWVETFSQLLEE
ncbi:hypothetical protein BJ875DRAFT_443108 [Amylocarpus encephaloides]|uniref:2EXR domain-containing protein n=1 Tax=Amylocarpus encephaloides TaxID=45428 RepID=A0A9P7YFJ0_9HELO|nr:hypothetical protein BJ875DRAFT_443108 [Amylocarpus encephaloides]